MSMVNFQNYMIWQIRDHVEKVEMAFSIFLINSDANLTLYDGLMGCVGGLEKDGDFLSA